MEVKINKEIRDYSSSFVIGLSGRQFGFTVAGALASVGAYFLLRNSIPTEPLQWICIAIVAPLAAMGFVKYNGMPLEKIVLAMLKTYITTPAQLRFHSKNAFYQSDKEKIEFMLKEESKRRD